jgi:hypothetical protein
MNPVIDLAIATLKEMRNAVDATNIEACSFRLNEVLDYMKILGAYIEAAKNRDYIRKTEILRNKTPKI